MTAQTPAERKRAEREAKRRKGLRPHEIWVRDEDWPKVRDLVAELTGDDT